MIEIEKTLGIAYYTKGYINIPVTYCQHFDPDDNMPIIIYLGNWMENSINGIVNRTDNRNNSPRIRMGVNYTRWVQAKHKQGGSILVSFDNPLYPRSILIQ